jgi:hypothetical protein
LSEPETKIVEEIIEKSTPEEIATATQATINAKQDALKEPTIETTTEPIDVEINKIDNPTTEDFLNISDKSNSPLSELSKAIRDQLGDVKTQIVDGLKDVFGNKRPANYGNNTISIDSKNPTKVKHFFHEAIHKITVDKLLQYERGDLSKLSSSEIDALENITRIFNESKTKLKEKGIDVVKSKEYGFTSVHEFLSEALTNTDFQRILKELPTEGKKPTVFKQLLNAIGKILGLKDATILDDIFHHTEKLLDKKKPEVKAEPDKVDVEEVGGAQMSTEQTITDPSEVQKSKTAYHGTSKEFSELKAYEDIKNPEYKEMNGVHLTSSKQSAQRFGKNIHEIDIGRLKLLDASDKTRIEFAVDWLMKNKNLSKTEALDLVRKEKTYKSTYDMILDKIDSGGYDGIKLNNEYKDGNFDY